MIYNGALLVCHLSRFGSGIFQGEFILKVDPKATATPKLQHMDGWMDG